MMERSINFIQEMSFSTSSHFLSITQLWILVTKKKKTVNNTVKISDQNSGNELPSLCVL